MTHVDNMTTMVETNTQNQESSGTELLSIQDLHVWFELRRWGFGHAGSASNRLDQREVIGLVVGLGADRRSTTCASIVVFISCGQHQQQVLAHRHRALALGAEELRSSKSLELALGHET